MNLLLLLSALFSALTGVSDVTVRPAAVVSASAQAVRSVAVASQAQTTRPAAKLVTLAQSARALVFSSLTLRAITPIFATRRRE